MVGIGNIWYMALQLYDLVQSPAVCGDDGVAPWRPVIHSNLGNVMDTPASSSCMGAPTPPVVGKAEPVGGQRDEVVDVS